VNRNALKWGVDFFVIFIRCLRVDRHTAERLQNMCELSLTTCVSQLVATSQLKVVKKKRAIKVVIALRRLSVVLQY